MAYDLQCQFSPNAALQELAGHQRHTVFGRQAVDRLWGRHKPVLRLLDSGTTCLWLGPRRWLDDGIRVHFGCAAAPGMAGNAAAGGVGHIYPRGDASGSSGAAHSAAVAVLHGTGGHGNAIRVSRNGARAHRRAFAADAGVRGLLRCAACAALEPVEPVVVSLSSGRRRDCGSVSGFRSTRTAAVPDMVVVSIIRASPGTAAEAMEKSGIAQLANHRGAGAGDRSQGSAHDRAFAAGADLRDRDGQGTGPGAARDRGAAHRFPALRHRGAGSTGAYYSQAGSADAGGV